MRQQLSQLSEVGFPDAGVNIAAFPPIRSWVEKEARPSLQTQQTYLPPWSIRNGEPLSSIFFSSPHISEITKIVSPGLSPDLKFRGAVR